MPPHSIPPLEAQEGVPRAGDVLAEKYRVERVLGGGGMGIVCAAMHLDLGERVALKFLLPSVLNEETVARFSREAKAAARIKSAHIARVTDIGCLETGSPYMVMEYLEGHNLKDLVTDRGPLPVKDAIEYILQTIEVLAEAHALGIVHRDLKPANIFLADRGGAAPIVKLIDFGISKVLPRGQSLPDDDPSMTQTSAWLGSPLYMSPEQLRSARDVDQRTDVWGLGVTLFELCAGTVPFNHTSFPDLCAMILHEPAPRLETYLPSAPPGLGDIVARCLEKDLGARYGSVAELAIALVPFAPQRARTVAERAVAISEAAGLIARSPSGRHPLDGTLPDEVMSPFADGTIRPPPPAESMPPPPGEAAPPQSSTTGGVTMGESSFPPVPRLPMVSSVNPADFADIAPPSNPAKIVAIVAAITVALGVVLYLTGVIHVDPEDRAPASAEGPAAVPEAPVDTTPDPSAEADEDGESPPDEEADPEEEASAPEADAPEADAPASDPPADAPKAAPTGKPTQAAAPVEPEVSPAAPAGSPGAQATAAPPATPPPSPPVAEQPPPAAPDPVKSKPLNEKCYTDGPDGTKIEKPCAW